MGPFLTWYLTITLLGWAVFPICYRFLPSLPDRGYSLSRILGLLLWGFAFWMPGSLGILQNDLGGILFALLALLAVSALSLRGKPFEEIAGWVAARLRQILTIEAVFLVAFSLTALIRSANPEIRYTEKPMELAFINAILRSDTLPPNDPWLSGYAISYYYFGYLITAMLARFTGVSGSIAFNLGLALVFALAALGIYGLLFNLLERRRATEHPGKGGSLLYALSGPFFVLVVSNLAGFLQVLHARHLFWSSSGSGSLTSSFWSWLDILDLRDPPVGIPSWLPDGFGSGAWWWWRASRVLTDYSFLDRAREIIDEFPFFSFSLGDLHPHVLSMPFAFLVLGMALNLYLGGSRGQTGWHGTRLCWQIDPGFFGLSAITLGGLAFLNTWDFPVYVGIIAASYSLFRLYECGWEWERVVEYLTLGMALGLSGILLYLPFYLGFSSQAGGFWPSLVYHTRGAHLWVMFAPLLLPLFTYLFYLWHGERQNGYIRQAFKLALLAAAGFLGLTLMVMVPLVVLPLLPGISGRAEAAGQMILASIEAPDFVSAGIESVRRRLAAPGGWMTLFGLLILTFAPLARRIFNGEPSSGCNEQVLEQSSNQDVKPVDGRPEATDLNNPGAFSTSFVLLMILAGALLVLLPEFIYLADQFSSRMNTIFKFYFQAWLLWGTAAAYATAVLLQSLRRIPAVLFSLALSVLVAAGLTYPVLAIWDKTQGLNPDTGWTLDGSAYLKAWNPDEMESIRFLQAAQPGVMVEAVRPDGGQYSDFARISTFSGLPTVLGWVGHEIQWRGGTKEIGDRQAHIERIYTSRSWEETQSLLDLYDIRYIYIGSRERNTYPVYEEKFKKYLPAVFELGEIAIYQLP